MPLDHTETRQPFNVQAVSGCLYLETGIRKGQNAVTHQTGKEKGEQVRQFSPVKYGHPFIVYTYNVRIKIAVS